MFKITEELCTSKGNRCINYAIDTTVFSILYTGMLFLILLGSVMNGESLDSIYILQKDNKFSLYIVVSVTFSVFYFLSEVFFKGKTIGKYVTNTIVVDKNGNIPHFTAILKRSLIRLIPFYWISFWGLTPRGWHDLASGTYVVDKEKLVMIKRKKLLNNNMFCLNILNKKAD